MQTTSFDLVYLDRDPRTGEPSACIGIKATAAEPYAGVSPDRLVSAQCLTFIEFDAEIRRLQAELDEIRAEARRKFYHAKAACAM
jgi:hypothetical protein